VNSKIIRPKAILFDLDDTISSYDSVCAPAWRKCCEDFVYKYGVNFSTEKLIDVINETRVWYWADPVRHKAGRENLIPSRRDVVRYSLKELSILDEEMVCELADNYTNMHNAMISLLPGAKEALEMVRDMGIRMAVITNGGSKIQRDKLERFEIISYFEKVFIDAEIGFSKPDKEIFQYALDQLQLKPDEVWMVGDNLVWDVFGAKQMGIYAVWNDFGKKGLPKDSTIIPDLIVTSIYEIVEIIRNK
jgi:putative hydrolase of the HAD superfamily